MNIPGKRVLITGGSSGIGAATATALARQGAHVVVAARRAERLHALVAEIAQDGGTAFPIVADFSQPDAIPEVVAVAAERLGGLDILMNNAGTGPAYALHLPDAQPLRNLIQVNLTAAILCTHAALPFLRKSEGALIVNIGSVAGEIPTDSIYSATKSGIRSFSYALRNELRGSNISVVLIEPGFIRTEMTAELNNKMPGPEIVARAVSSAIRRPRRCMVVPGVYRVPLLLAKLFPGLTDVFLARQFREHQAAEK